MQKKIVRPPTFAKEQEAGLMLCFYFFSPVETEGQSNQLVHAA